MKPSHRVTPLRALLGRPSHALAFLILLTAAAPAQAAPTLADFGHKNMEAKGKRPLLVIVIDPEGKVDPKDRNRDFQQLLLGFTQDPDDFEHQYRASSPVLEYFSKVSGAGFTGGGFNWAPVGPAVPGRNLLGVRDLIGVSEFNMKVKDRKSRDFNAEVIRQANERFNFLNYKDGAVLIIDTKGDYSQTDLNVKVDLPQKATVQLRVVRVGYHAGLMTICNGLMQTLGAVELYGPKGDMNGHLTTMAATIFSPDDKQSFYLDPWHRMQFGWVQPEIRDMRVAGSFDLTWMKAIKEVNRNKPDPKPLILYDPARAATEYFILEYRNKTPQPPSFGVVYPHYDENVAGNGLCIWHVRQGSDKKLTTMPSEADPKKNVVTLYNRGAPDFRQGGNKLYTAKDGEIVLRWMDRSDTGIRLRVTGPLLKSGDPASSQTLRVGWGPRPRSGASIIQSSFGNLEVVAQEGNELWHWFLVPGKVWTRGSVITSKATGPGSICQNTNDHFEVAALEGKDPKRKDLVHYWAVAGKPYTRGLIITNKATGPGAIMASGRNNLECVVPEGKNLVHYWANNGRWKFGSVITNKATGPGGIARNKNGHFEVVALEGKELVHYWTEPGKLYNRGKVITNKATGPGSILFGSTGHLEVIVPEGKDLVHYWFDNAWHRGKIITNKTDKLGVGALCGNRNHNFELVVIEGNQIVHYWEEPGKAWNRAATY